MPNSLPRKCRVIIINLSSRFKIVNRCYRDVVFHSFKNVNIRDVPFFLLQPDKRKWKIKKKRRKKVGGGKKASRENLSCPYFMVTEALQRVTYIPSYCYIITMRPFGLSFLCFSRGEEKKGMSGKWKAFNCLHVERLLTFRKFEKNWKSENEEKLARC